MKWQLHVNELRIGKARVKDATAFAWLCPRCGEVELTLRELSGYERRAAAIVLRDGRKAGGEAVRFARKALGLTQKGLAEALGAEPETVSRWETGALAPPRTLQLALVSLLEGVEFGALDPDHLTGPLRAKSSGRSSLELQVPADARRKVG